MASHGLNHRDAQVSVELLAAAPGLPIRVAQLLPIVVSPAKLTVARRVSTELACLGPIRGSRAIVVFD